MQVVEKCCVMTTNYTEIRAKTAKKNADCLVLNNSFCVLLFFFFFFFNFIYLIHLGVEHRSQTKFILFAVIENIIKLLEMHMKPSE